MFGHFFRWVMDSRLLRWLFETFRVANNGQQARLSSRVSMLSLQFRSTRVSELCNSWTTANNSTENPVYLFPANCVMHFSSAFFESRPRKDVQAILYLRSRVSSCFIPSKCWMNPILFLCMVLESHKTTHYSVQDRRRFKSARQKCFSIVPSTKPYRKVSCRCTL